jgi:uncharacterized protein with LGFP repeats
MRALPLPACPHAAKFVRAGIGLLTACTLSSVAISTADATPAGADPVSAAPGVTRAAAGARLGPHAVPPSVTDISVPAVPPQDRAVTLARIATSAGAVSRFSANGILAAHLRSPLTHRFSMVGVTWDAGTAADGTTVAVRAHAGGMWSHWTQLPVEQSEAPGPGEDSLARAGTAPGWFGASSGVEVAVYSSTGSTPRHLDVNVVDPGTSTYDSVATKAGVTDSQIAARAGRGRSANEPRIITRRQWGADPSLGDRCWDPRIGDSFRMVFVHHTAGSNHYSESESAAVVRGVYAFHTQARGWCDIAYNFLVDRYGNIYEGRRGGIFKPVRGAHAGDYNVDTTGISLMGDFTRARPTRAMKHALVQLVAWRMGSAYHGAYGHTTIAGATFKRISGHRDAMSTSCPGQRVYDWLPVLRKRVAARLSGRESRIEARWRQLGGRHSRLGAVSILEQKENGGRHTAFQTGRMYSSSGGGLHVLRNSAVLTKYVRIGETSSVLGYPSSNLRSVANDTGASASFGGGKIFFSHATGATVLVRSAILKRYLAEGGPGGSLGFPLVHVHPTRTGATAGFQHGTITYEAARHRTVVTYS